MQPAVVLQVVFSDDARLLTSHRTTHPLANLSCTWCSCLDSGENFSSQKESTSNVVYVWLYHHGYAHLPRFLVSDCAKKHVEPRYSGLAELSWTLEISHLRRLARTSQCARWLRYQADPGSISSSAQLGRGLHPWIASWRGPARPARPMGMERTRERVEYAMRTTVISYIEKRKSISLSSVRTVPLVVPPHSPAVPGVWIDAWVTGEVKYQLGSPGEWEKVISHEVEAGRIRQCRMHDRL